MERWREPWQGSDNGFDQTLPDEPSVGQVHELANKAVTGILIKKGLKNERDFDGYLKWLYAPVEITDDIARKTKKLIQRKGNIFDASKRIKKLPPTHGKP